MSSLLLERIRSLHEDIERYESGITSKLEKNPGTQKDRVTQLHSVSQLVTNLNDHAQNLSKLYEDDDGMLMEELKSMKGAGMFNSFYDRLTRLREHHVRYPNRSIQKGPDLELEGEPKVQFSGGEVFGKYLDLHAFHDQFINLPHYKHLDERVEYTTYLTLFDRLDEIHEKNKMTSAYREYVANLSRYLMEFLVRIHPLGNLTEIFEEMDTSFEVNWKTGNVKGWEDRIEKIQREEEILNNGGHNGGGINSKRMNGGNHQTRLVDLSNISSAEELEVLGLERLKEGLLVLGLKCGGTLKDRAERLWLTKDKELSELDPKLFAKKKKEKRKREDGVGDHQGGKQVEERKDSPDGVIVFEDKEENRFKQLARLEYRVGRCVEYLTDVIRNTKRHVEKSQTRSYEENQKELEEEEHGYLPTFDHTQAQGERKGGGEGDSDMDSDDEDDDEEIVFNPHNLPIGWDGQPIPYWLYKEQGLGIEHTCEICGNYSYWGHRAFQKHFQVLDFTLFSSF